MGNIILTVVLIIVFSVISAGAAAYFAFKRGEKTGIGAEKDRQVLLRQSAEEQAEHILREAETEAKQMIFADFYVVHLNRC